MAYLMRFFENWIRQSMEDPIEREEKVTAHIRKTKEDCERLRQSWAQPTKPYGFWSTDKNNHKYLLDISMSPLSGRKDAYDQVMSEDDSKP